jgi:predicted DNA-binding transcriptional regulator AlpA
VNGALVLTVAEVADEFHYSPSHLRTLVRAGRFPQPIDPSYHPKSWRWSRRRLEQWVDAGTQEVVA